MNPTPERIARFWAKVDQSGGPDTCWPWQGFRFPRTGHGMLSWCGTQTYAHRVAWELTHGPIPLGLCVCHNCPGEDYPPCCNPAHLWLGTAGENTKDMWAKGRGRWGNGRTPQYRPTLPPWYWLPTYPVHSPTLLALRQARGWDYETACQLSGLHPTTVRRLECGTWQGCYRVKRRTFTRLAAIYDLSVSDLRTLMCKALYPNYVADPALTGAAA